MDRRNLPEVRDGSRDPPKGPGLVWGPSWKSRTGRGTLPEVRNRLGALPEARDGS